jgi:hypothetical protein
MGHLRQHSVKTRSMPNHVMLKEANMAAVDPISHPNGSNCRLLLPINHNLHLPKTDHHIFLQHLATVDGKLFARAAPVASLSANNFHNDAGRVKCHLVWNFC